MDKSLLREDHSGLEVRGHGKNSFFFDPLIIKLNNNKIHCHIHVTMYLYDRNTKKEVYKYE